MLKNNILEPITMTREMLLEAERLNELIRETNRKAGLKDSADPKQQLRGIEGEFAVYHRLNNKFPQWQDLALEGTEFKQRKEMHCRPCDLPIDLKMPFTGQYEDMIGYEMKTVYSGLNLVADIRSLKYIHDLAKPFILFQRKDTKWAGDRSVLEAEFKAVGWAWGCDLVGRFNDTPGEMDRPGYKQLTKTLHPMSKLPSEEKLVDIVSEVMQNEDKPVEIKNEAQITEVRELIKKHCSNAGCFHLKGKKHAKKSFRYRTKFRGE